MSEKKGLRNTRVWKRFIAICMAIVMVVTMTPVTQMGKSVSAKQVDGDTISVRIKFYEFDQETAHTPAIENPGNDQTAQNYHVVATLKDKNSGEVKGFGFAILNNINQANQTVEISNFYTTKEVDYRPNNWSPAVKQNAWEDLEGGYDPAKYDVTLRLLYGDSPSYVTNGNDWFGNPIVVAYGASYNNLMSQASTIDGYLFKGSSVEGYDGLVEIYKGEQAFEVNLAFDPSAGTITDEDNYYLLVTADHQTTGTSYFYKKITTDGSENPVRIKVQNGNSTTGGDWTNRTGQAQFEKFSTNWAISVKIVKAMDGASPSLEQALGGNDIADGNVTYINGYTVSYATKTTKDRDETTETDYVCQTINLKKASSSKDFTLYDILGDSLYYGLTAPQITLSHHSETNLATKVFSNPGNGNYLEPDLSGIGTKQVPGTFLIGEITGEEHLQFGNGTPKYPVVMIGSDDVGKVTSSVPGVAVTVGVDKQDINDTVDGMVNHMLTVSAELAAQEPSDVGISIYNQILHIDATALPDGSTIYIDGDKYLEDYISKGEKVQIKKNPNQIIVFNFKSKDVTIGKVYVDNGNGLLSTQTKELKFSDPMNPAADEAAQGLVWNMINAEKFSQVTAGGVFLIPNKNCKCDIGNASCGWVVSAAPLKIENGEFHFVYRGLKEEGVSSVQLQVFKTVDGVNATADQKFVFGLERFDSSVGDFVTIEKAVLDSDGKPTGDTIPYTVDNTKNRVTFAASNMEEGRNIYRIKELKKAADTTGNYTLDTAKEVYASFNVTVKTLEGGTEVKIPGVVTYYGKYDNGVLSEQLDNDGRTFKNKTKTTVEKTKLSLKKTFGGDVVESDKDTLSFEVKDETGAVIATFTLADFDGPDKNGAYKLKPAKELEVEVGSTYTVTEKNYDATGVGVEVSYKIGTGSSTKNATATVDVTEKKPITVEFTDTYPTQTAKIILTKTFGGPVVEDDFETLTFLVKKDGSTAEATYTLKDFTYDKDTKTYTKEITLTGAAELGKYTITELNYNKKSGAAVEVSYKLDGGDKTVQDDATGVSVIVANGDSKTVAFTDDYLTGDLEVTKTVEGQNLVNTYKVSVKNEKTGDYYDATGKVVTGDAKWIEVTAGTAKKFSNLPLGKYTVEEDTTSVDVPGYTFLTASSHTKETEVEVKRGTTAAKVTITNKYSQIVGKLTIKKTVSNNTTRTAFRVTVQDASGNYYDENGANKGTTETWVNIVAGTPLTIENLPMGAYTVTEDKEDAKIEHYILDEKDSVTTVTSDAISAAVTEVTVDLSNVYIQKKGTLRFEKTFGGPVVEADKDTLSFLVTKEGDNTGTTYKLADMDTIQIGDTVRYYKEITLYNDDLGKYTIVEQNYNQASGASVKVTYSLNGGVQSEMPKNGVTVEVDEGDSSIVAFNDQYLKDGEIVITKTFGGPVVEEDFANLYFVVTKDGETTGTEYWFSTFDYDATTKTYTKKITVKPEDLGKYTVKETNYNSVSKAQVAVTYKVGNAEGSGDTATVTVGEGKSEVVEFTNTYPDKVGKLIITKTFGGDVVEADFETLKFVVTKDGSSAEAVYTLKDFQYDADKKIYTKEIELKNGELGKYFIKETNYNEKSGASVEVSYTIDGTKTVQDNDHVASVIVADGGNKTVAFNNEYLKDGEIVITKTFGGPVVEEDFANLFFEVTKEGSEKVDTYNFSEFTYDKDTDTYTKKITVKHEDLGKYTVKETNYNSVSKAQVAVTYKVGNAEGSGDTATVTVGEGKSEAVEFTNTYPDKVGKLIITKTFGGDVVEADFETLKFVVTKEGATTGTTYALKDFQYDADKKIYTKEIELKNDDLGKYSIKETNYNEKSGASVEVSYTIDGTKTVQDNDHVASVTVADGGNKTVAFNNEYLKDGEIVITKTFGGPVVEEDFANLFFEVTKEGSEKVDTYYFSEFTYDKDTDTYTKKITVKHEDLGKYTVKESNYNSVSKAQVAVTYKVGNAEGSGDTATVTVGEGKSEVVEFTNTYPDKVGKLIITKTFGGDVVEADFETLKFVVTKDGSSAEAVYTLKDFQYDADKKIYTKEIELKNGELGKYFIKETNYNEKSGASVEVSYTIDGTKTVQDNDHVASVIVADGGNKTVAFNNEYLEEKGSLEIEKVFQGVKPEGVTFSVEITGPKDYKNTLTYPDDFKNGKATIADIPVGEYTVTEKGLADVTVGAKKYFFITTSSKTEVKADVEKNKTATAKLENFYTAEDTGKLTIVKTFGGEVVEEDLKTLSFRITEKGTDKYVTSYTLAKDFEKKADGSYVLKEACELPLGAYVVTETNYDNTGAKVEVTYEVGNKKGTGEDADFELAKKDDEVTVAFNNRYPEAGKLVITKTFGGPVVEEDKKTLFFEVNKEGTNKIDIYHLSDFTYDKDAETYTLEIDLKGDQLGTYHISERNYNEKSGAAVTVSYKYGNGVYEEENVDITVGEGKTETVEFNNEYPSGKLTVHVTEKTSGLDVPNAEVEIKYPDDSKHTFKTNDKGEVTDDDGNVLEVLPGDYEVTVTKVPEGYDVTTGETGTVKVPKDGEGHHDAEIETDRGGIILTVFDEETGDVVPNATVEVTTPDGNTKVYTTDKNGQITEFAKKDEFGNYTAETGEYTYKVTKVPTGYHVTVGEEQTGTVEAGKLTELEAKIAPQETGKLTIHVSERNSGLDVPGAEVEVTDEDGNTKTYTTDENGTVTDDNGDVLEVPAGEYTVTVTKVPEGYDVETGKQDVVIVPKDGEGHHEAVIATDRGGIIITVYDEITGDVVPNATIVVITPSGEEKTFTTDENGQVTEFAKKDEYGNYTAETGEYKYTVTEVPEGYRVTVGEEQTAEVKTSELTELEAKIAPKTGGLDIKVVDEKTKAPVPGATVEIGYPDGSIHTFVTDENGMITELSKKDDEGRFTARIGTYTITVTKVPEGYTVTTGKTVEEIIEVDQLKHHVAEIATATKDKTVQTGDSTPIVLLIVLMIMSAAGFVFVISRKRKNAR